MKNEYRAPTKDNDTPYKAGNEVDRCEICGINLYDMPDRPKPWPAVFPCSLPNCPYESKDEQIEANNIKLIAAVRGRDG